MKIVSLKAANGKFVTAIAGDEGLIIANSEEHSPFWMEDLGDGKVQLRAMTNKGRYLEAIDGGGKALLALKNQPSANSIFTKINVTKDEIALQTANGKNFVSCGSDGVISGAGKSQGKTEVFTLTRFVQKGEVVTSYEQAEPLWDDKTHANIVKRATDIIFEHHGARPAVRYLQMFWKSKVFTDALLKGLHDADYKPEFTGPAYKYHFYHPGTRQNYVGTGENAVTMGAKYSEKAVAKGSEIMRKLKLGITPSNEEYRACGYDLGVASHFITDLTQPMHSSNFANVFADRFPVPNPLEWRHSGLEGATEKLIKAGYLDDAARFEYSDFAPDSYGSAASILVEAAFIANRTFEGTVRNLMPSVIESWKVANVKTILDASIKSVGLHSVARFLSFFALQAYNTELVKPGRLYVLEGRDRMVATRDGEWIKMQPQRSNSPNQQFFFASNNDGTHRIICNADRARRWTLSNVGSNLFVINLKKPNEADLKYCKFRLVANGRGRVKIHEYTNAEVIAERAYAPNWNDHLHRWADMNEPTHVFKLIDVGAVQLSEEVENGVVEEIQTVDVQKTENSKTVNVNLTINM